MSTRIFFNLEINAYFKFDITCFLVKVRSCLLSSALMRRSLFHFKLTHKENSPFRYLFLTPARWTYIMLQTKFGGS